MLLIINTKNFFWASETFFLLTFVPVSENVDNLRRDDAAERVEGEREGSPISSPLLRDRDESAADNLSNNSYDMVDDRSEPVIVRQNVSGGCGNRKCLPIDVEKYGR